jgi:hypothetical protein
VDGGCTADIDQRNFVHAISMQMLKSTKEADQVVAPYINRYVICIWCIRMNETV